MKRRLTIGLLLLASCCVCTQAQVKSKPNLSGTWIVDATRSEKTNNPLEDSETSVTIQQNDPEIKLVRTLGSFTVTSIYFSDGRGETHKDPATGHELKSKTKWDGDKLVTRYTGRRFGIGTVTSMDIIEEWKLSKDGKTLTKKITVLVPRNALDRVNAVQVAQPSQEFKKVYNLKAP
jgi:hypothetical protein